MSISARLPAGKYINKSQFSHTHRLACRWRLLLLNKGVNGEIGRALTKMYVQIMILDSRTLTAVRAAWLVPPLVFCFFVLVYASIEFRQTMSVPH
jgi:hypothetical protein